MGGNEGRRIMGKNLNRVGMLFAALGFATAAHAASYAEECECSVWVPKHDAGFRFGVEALYFAPSLTHTEYVRTANNFLDFRKTFNVNPDYQWGVKLEGQYNWAGTGNDVRLSFLDIHLSERAKLDLPDTGIFDFPFAPPFTPPTVFTDFADLSEYYETTFGWFLVERAVGKFEADHLAIDLEFGQAIATKYRVNMRFHGGLRYAQVDAKMRQTYLDNTLGNSISFTDRSNWEGIGPRFGVDANLPVTSDYDVVGGFSAAILVGDMDVKNTAQVIDRDIPSNNREVRHVVSYDHRITLSHDAYLGLRRTWAFHDNMALSLEGGYHVTNYTDVDNKITTAGTDLGTNGAYLRVDLLI